MVTSNSPQSLLQTEKERRKTTDPYVDHYNKTRLAVTSKAIAVSLGVILLFGPVLLLLFYPVLQNFMVLVVFGFVLVFSIIISSITKASPEGILISIMM